MTERWIRTYENGLDYIESLGGIEWGQEGTRLPPAWHRCKPQTRGMMRGEYIERCNCGAHGDGRTWIYKNETSKGRKRDRRIAGSPKVHLTCRSCGKEYDTTARAPDANGQCNRCWSDAFVRTGRP